MSRPELADMAERARAVHERERNVIVDAGAGTGKTTLLVARVLHLVAPEDDGPAFPLDRVAAITFTRKAAGELKLRLREALLSQSGRSDLSAIRAARLNAALESLDNAMISTVHSFADRLLRLRPADARISPEYEIAEDPTPLIDETFTWLLDAVARGTVATGLTDPDAKARAAEAAETVRTYQAAGLLTRTQEFEFFAKLGLNALVEDMVQSRDRALIEPALEPPDVASVQRNIDEFLRTVGELREVSDGSRTLHRLLRAARRILVVGDTCETLRRGIAWRRDVDRMAKDLNKRDHFVDDAGGWEARRWIVEGKRGRGRSAEERSGGPLGEAVVAPLLADMAVRLVRLRPVVLARYEATKRAHGVLDQLDLLIALRDLLATNLEARAFYQARLDHVLVDEFQDTDPLQAEIVTYLCEAGAKATTAAEVTLAPGKLTIVGDPKQSIYRFRRADIAMYTAVCERMRQGPVCQVKLTVNFRSADSVLDWLNQAFDAVLGAGDGPALDMERGAVRNVRLVSSGDRDAHADVHIVPSGDSELNAEDARDVEGRALAHYLRYLVEDGEARVRDPRTRELRKPHYGDIAVMMISTQTVHHLTSELDRIGVPHVVRGGTLFMQDSLHKQFVLGLRALSDRSDGVARAALLRPPFFAVTLEDLARQRAGVISPAMQQTDELVGSLRAMRHQHTPGEIARLVLEQTGFGMYVAAGVNGPQRLARLYELCLYLDDIARESKLNFDGVTELARTWIEAPTRIEAPLPIETDAVQVITAHQAKGLEWPIVALWDGRASWRAFLPPVALAVDGLTGEWALKLDGLAYDPTERALQEREVALRAEERKRVVYVAATRARSILIVPESGEPKEATIAGKLLCTTRDRRAHRVAAFEGEGEAWWGSARGVSMRPLPAKLDNLDAAWAAASERAIQPRLAPAAVNAVAHLRKQSVDEEPVSEPLPRVGRYGARFGSAVHRALELLLSGRAHDGKDAAVRASRELGFDNVELVSADVMAAEVALRRERLLEQTLRHEYPIAGSLSADQLVSGYIDLLAVSPEVLSVIDYKTDQPPHGDVTRVYPAYVSQVRAYATLLEHSGVHGSRAVRSGLLFTADGSLHWVSASRSGI